MPKALLKGVCAHATNAEIVIWAWSTCGGRAYPGGKNRRRGGAELAALDAYELILDFSTTRTPVALAWIRETYKVRVLESIEPLKKGDFKEAPNHVIQPDGSIHYCAVPEETHSEMTRFVPIILFPKSDDWAMSELAFSKRHSVASKAFDLTLFAVPVAVFISYTHQFDFGADAPQVGDAAGVPR